MLNNVKIVLSLAMVAATASGALAATKHRRHVDPQAQTAGQLPAGSAYGQSGSAQSARMPIESGAMLIQDRDYRESVVGVPWFGSK
jgi:hypothetical protein